MITKQALGSLLFGMADILRDKVEDYKSYILSLLFYKRLSDNYQWEIEHGKEKFVGDYSREPSARELEVITKKMHDFIIPEGCFWEDVRKASVDKKNGTELIVNAVAHRDYSILGTDIMVKIFDHHYVVESPGILPGMVRVENIRQMHFSRNPKIVQFIQQYKLVKEFGEGVGRMFREMAEAGNPAPEYKQIEFMVKVRLNSVLREDRNGKALENDINNENVNIDSKSKEESGLKSGLKSDIAVINEIKHNPNVTIPELQSAVGLSRYGIKKVLARLREQGLTAHSEHPMNSISMRSSAKCLLDGK